MLKGVDLSLSTYILQLSRKGLRILIGLLTGHADLNRHLTLMSDRTHSVLSVNRRKRRKRQLSISLRDVTQFYSLNSTI